MNAKTLNKMTKDALVQQVLQLNDDLYTARYELAQERKASGVTQSQVGIVRYRLAQVVDLDPATRTTVLKELDTLFQ